jgi:rare lipoprotein A
VNIIKRILVLVGLLFAFMGISHASEVVAEQSYKVQDGDNLTVIAKKFSIADFRDIAKANGLSAPYTIYARKSLRIPAHSTNQEEPSVLSKRLEKPLLTHDETGVASWYGKRHHGKKTASGEAYNMHALTVAHPTLPFGTKVRIEVVASGKSVIARVNDRGPFVKGRIVDVSYHVAGLLGIVKSGTGIVRLVMLEKQERKPPHARVAVSLRKDLESTHREDTTSVTTLSPILLSEVVVTEFGPAHVIDGLNQNQIPKESAIALLFPHVSEDVREHLLALIDGNRDEKISLHVGDELQQMLPAEGIVYRNVLQAQMSDHVLPARCYAFYDEGLAKSFVLIHEMYSGNWYGEEIGVKSTQDSPCSRNRNESERKL